MSHVGGHKKAADYFLKLARRCSLWPVRKLRKPKEKP